MGMDDCSATKETLVPRGGLKKAVRRIMGITKAASHSTRYRILTPVVRCAILSTMTLETYHPA